MTQFNAVEFAKVSAATALDQINAYESKSDAVWSHFENLRSTMEENGVTGQYIIQEAEETYWKLVGGVPEAA